MEKLEIKYSFIGHKMTMAKLLKALADLMISCWLILKIAIVLVDYIRLYQ
jgi:hypothetical protein